MTATATDGRTEAVDVANALAKIYATRWPAHVLDVLLAPSGMGTAHSLETALEQIDLPPGLLPLAVVDEASIAVVALDDLGGRAPAGTVFRWFVTPVEPRYQLAVLDIHPLLYVLSVNDELCYRETGLNRVLDQIGPAYEESFLAKDKRPRDFVTRPVRIACQNVIVGLAAFAQDSAFDGLSAVAWQTCEVPHVATHEANRALAALTLCDAFQNGGTMEIRFDRPAQVTVGGTTKKYGGHPERQVPASLRRFGRTVGVPLGADDPAAVTPREARELFLAITPMPAGLRSRVDQAIASGLLPERICFALLAQVWREIELEFLLATTRRAPSILAGGADWQHRGARQAEAGVCRAAVMIGMLYRRLNSTDTASADAQVRVVEDISRGVTWEIDPHTASVVFAGLDPASPVPWTHGLAAPTLRVIAAGDVTDEVLQAASGGEPLAVLVPRDVHPVGLPPGVAVLRCPDRLADLDKAVEAKLLTSRISRG